MTARTSAIAAVMVALAAAGGLGVTLASTRASRAEAYARERSAQRRAAAATRPVPAPSSPVEPAKTGPGCVTGVDSFAVAVERALVAIPPTGKQRRVTAIRQLSAEAVRAERTAELGGAAPTLPKRMGVVDGAPLVPEKGACDGKGFAELR